MCCEHGVGSFNILHMMEKIIIIISYNTNHYCPELVSSYANCETSDTMFTTLGHPFNSSEVSGKIADVTLTLLKTLLHFLHHKKLRFLVNHENN